MAKLWYPHLSDIYGISYENVVNFEYLFKKLHCTRNYIHLNLFLSFILKAISVLMKDDFLYSGYYTCPDSLTGCKIMLAFVHYCVTANFYWLLVEGLYLHTLLVVIFSPNRHFIIYLLIGWGIPTVCIITWIFTRIYLEDTGCWDTNEHSIPWWVIRSPIILSIIVNFCLFINIIRILLQKLRSPDVGGNDQSQFKRLTKSTLLLIPLFGVHYMVFAVFPISSFNDCQIWFELCIGSFQGLVVAILYCFLNTEVQGEIKRKWGSLFLNTYLNRDFRLHSFSISRNGSECASQFKRNSRAPSIMQTETSILVHRGRTVHYVFSSLSVISTPSIFLWSLNDLSTLLQKSAVTCHSKTGGRRGDPGISDRQEKIQCTVRPLCTQI
ncbi:unnamed protein product [Ranitomeya imitator]|uniref:G-protein coupled receptors family 2 profile 2 domain-containing protein n=1 Tax=Ranitomeya imitator TaxID=111125 RepID=A0ABN9LTX9_9NEOB|nr:unnamed protein product [Ranitomeya imitator]